MKKPFDLQAALNGAKVVNGNGTEVFITHMARPTSSKLVVISQDATGRIQAYHFADGNTESNSEGFRLYMAPVEVTRFINFYNYPSQHYTTHPTLEAADDAARVAPRNSGLLFQRLGGKALPITFSE